MTSTETRYPEAKALCDHTNSAANSAQTIWFGLLTYGAFLVVAVFGTTHEMLFLETPISLPILSINLDLVGFYVAAPILLVVLHLYLLVKLVLLSASYANFEAQVEHDIASVADKAQIRKHLNTTIFIQALKAQRESRGLLGFLLWLLLFLTLVLGPVAALFITQIYFLPYQSSGVTIVHRVLLALDLIVIVIALEATFHILGFVSSLLMRLLVYPISVMLIFVSLLISFPGERFGLTDIDWPFPTTLQLANEQFVADLDFDVKNLKSTLQMGDRQFVGADFRGADLRKTVFDGANLRGAAFNGARLQDASFDGTKLQSASFVGAGLQGASLETRELQNGDHEPANLQGASLELASLQGASLEFAWLQGASLFDALLQSASLLGASLQGASLDHANLQSASLFEAELKGASLDHAKLQGASLYGVKLQGTSLDSTLLWRTHGKLGDRTNVWVSQPQTDNLTYQQFKELTKDAMEGIESEDLKERIEGRLTPLNPRSGEPNRVIDKTFWTDLESETDVEDHRSALVGILENLACDGKSAPYVAQGLIRPAAFDEPARLEAVGHDHLPRIANRLLDAAEGRTDDCPGAIGMNADSIAQLRKWIAEADDGTQDQIGDE